MITLAALTLSGLLPLLIQLVVAGLIFWVILWFIGYVGIPEPFNRAARIIVALVAVIYVVNLLLSLSGLGHYTT